MNIINDFIDWIINPFCPVVTNIMKVKYDTEFGLIKAKCINGQWDVKSKPPNWTNEQTISYIKKTSEDLNQFFDEQTQTLNDL